MKKPSSFVICSLLSVICLASCAEMFQERLPFKPNNGSLGDLFAVEAGDVKLAVPAQFYVAPYYSAQEIRLTWEGVQGAAYYMVERATVSPVPESNPPIWENPDEGDYEVLNRFVYGTSFTDVILTNAALNAPDALDAPQYQNKYFYRVSAFNTAKKYEESDPTEPLSAMLFRAPANVKASGGASVDYIEVTWEKSENAQSYEIWRSDYSNGASPYLVQTVRAVLADRYSYRNMVTEKGQGTDYYYMITAVNRSGNKSLQTRPAYGYAKVFGAPDSPLNVRLAAGSGRGNSTNAPGSIAEIRIKWDPVDELDAYYAVFRYSNVDASLTRLTEKTEDPCWTDKLSLKQGIYYYYKVQAIVYDNASGKELKSQFSSPDPEGFIISPPDTVLAEKDENGVITVKWYPPIGSEGERLLYTYNVYSDNRMDGAFETVAAAGIVPAVDSAGYISVAGLSADNAFFKVSTVNGGVESAKSVVVAPAPAAALIQSASQYAFISQDAAPNSSGVYPVKITWKKPDDENENPAFYHVQRSTRSGSGFSRINETALGASGPYSGVYSYDPVTKVFTFIDKNETAKVGRKYYYRVISLNQLEQGNFSSEERIDWGELTHTQYMLEYNKTMKSALKKLTLMHKPGSTDKLGTETKYGTISGSIYYNGALSGLGARIIIQLTNYADFYIENEPDKGVYFTITGNSNTTANMSSNGTMDGTVTCTGMYPGRVYYDNIEIKGGAAGGGTYGIYPEGGFQRAEVSWTVGEQ